MNCSTLFEVEMKYRHRMKAILPIAIFSVGIFWDDLKQKEISIALKNIFTKEENWLQSQGLKHHSLYISFFIIVLRKSILLAIKMA